MFGAPQTQRRFSLARAQGLRAAAEAGQRLVAELAQRDYFIEGR
jgi:hypothetical protein